jgi:hypothetical protein
MAIWLGKQYLGQKEAISIDHSGDGMLADLIEGLRDQNENEGQGE